MHPLDTITYLKSGNARQRKAYALLVEHQIFEKLAGFSPVLTGTIPLNIDIESSDLDIICYWTNKNDFIETLPRLFGDYENFQLREKTIGGEETIVANLSIEGLPVEIFGQNIPVKQQAAYRHMIIEYQILLSRGESFRKQVIELKRQGLKTEPAFARLLGLEGDPYEAMLNVNVS